MVDGRTDIYSLGIILYEMLVGSRPYQGDSAIKVIMQHIQSPLPVLPDELSDYQPLLSRIMAKNREQRAPDAATMVREVEAFLGYGTNPENTVATLRAKLREHEQAARIAREATAKQAARPSWLRELASPRLMGLFACLVVLIGMFIGLYVYTQSWQPTVLLQTRAPLPASESPNGAATSLADRTGLSSSGAA